MSDITYDTYTQVGIREDLADAVYEIAAKETPFISNGKKDTTSNTKVEWQTQALRAPQANRFAEGNKANATSAIPTSRLNNYTQISKQVFEVSGTADAVDRAGAPREFVNQSVLRGVEVRRDMEFSLLSNVATDGQTTSASARVAGGLPAWITNANAGGSTTLPNVGNGATTVTLSTSVLRSTSIITFYSDAHQKAYEDGGDPTMILLSPTQKAKFSAAGLGGSANTADVRSNISGTRAAAVIGSVETYLSDFGTLDIVVDRQMTSNFLKRSAFLLDPRYYGICYLRDMMSEELAKTGDARKGHVLAEYTLKVHAPTAHAAVYDLSDS